MSTHDQHPEAHDDGDLPADIAALLADAEVWAEVDHALTEDTIAAVLAEAADTAPSAMQPAVEGAERAGVASPTQAPPATVVSLDERRNRRWALPALAGAAAALALVFGILGLSRLTDSGPDVELVLAATDLAPGASAVAEITETGVGTLIRLDVEDLEPAPPGTYYEAWLRIDAEQGVSAGTFHLREGDDAIHLWAGVSPQQYPLLTVTLQPEGLAESSGQVVLRARFDN